MKRLTFGEGVVVAIGMALTAGIVFYPVAMLVGKAIALRTAITIVGGAYSVYLITRSTERSGYLALGSVWLLGSMATWLIAPSLIVFCALHLLLIWLTRALYHCTSPITAGLDLSLHGFAFLTAVWGAVQTNSVMVSVWCLFLVLTLFVWIPGGRQQDAHSDADPDTSNRAFNDAFDIARAAAEKLAKT